MRRINEEKLVTLAVSSLFSQTEKSVEKKLRSIKIHFLPRCYLFEVLYFLRLKSEQMSAISPFFSVVASRRE